MDLMNKLLTYDPLQRISADEALKHPYFKRITHAISVINLLNFIFSETPLPKHPDAFQSFPSIAAGEKPNLILLLPPTETKTERKTTDMTLYCKPSFLLIKTSTHHAIHGIVKIANPVPCPFVALPYFPLVYDSSFVLYEGCDDSFDGSDPIQMHVQGTK
ncbi:hypothetical protein H4Q26_015712 [Puccinia striiformis f. sp. tritici PST-130]|nr:hypothetical protein H4Q26_015712 [Puccinia striiformis f. sp. tritici PST-130]